MIIKELKLKNIRSYENQTLQFPLGTTLLAGDIGSGKTTLLLSIEFALFGILKGLNSTESLLRYGSKEGEVELTIIINDKELKIGRKLKRTKKGITQDSGYIITNDTLKKLSPVELKSYILNLINYPRDMLKKSKGFIYRYTVYTPQEEMKQILLENDEDRLNTLRRVFGIDKYKNIKNNLGIIIKELKQKKLIKEIKTENIEKDKKKNKELKNKITTNKKEIEIIRNKIIDLNLDELKEKNELLKTKESLLDKLKQELTFIGTLKTESEKEHEKELFEIKYIKAEINTIIDDLEEKINLKRINENEIIEKLQKITSEISQINNKKEFLEQKIKFLVESTKEQDEQLRKISENSTLSIQLKNKKNILQEKLNDLKIEDSNKLTEEITKIKIKINETTTKINNSNKLILNINTAKICPLCLQYVSKDHKEKIKIEEEQKINQYNLELNTLKNQLNKEIKTEENNKTQILNKEKLELEINNLTIKIKNYDEELTQMIKINKKLIEIKTEIEKSQDELKNLKNIDELIKIEKELKQQLNEATHTNKKINYFEKQELLLNEKRKRLNELNKKIKENNDKIVNLRLKLINTTKNIKKEQEEIKELDKFRTEFKIKNKEKEQETIKIEKLNTEIERDIIELNENELIINFKENLLKEIKKTKQIILYLSEKFLPLTQNIEKHVFSKVYNEFNSLFEEWFNTLLEDDSITARLNENFGMQIIQNGHETDFQYLSGGEKTSISLAYRLALNKVINNIQHSINTKDLIILDEPTDGFSSEQLEKVKEVLNQLNIKQKIIVSHEEQIESFVDNIIRIKKTNHTSVIQNSKE